MGSFLTMPRTNELPNEISQCKRHYSKTSGLPVEAMCWAPDGGMIIFASDSYLYTILVLACEEDFVDVENARSAIPVFDLRTIQALQEGTGYTF
ncbi:unnamed protein product, partial [Allacma fusca]